MSFKGQEISHQTIEGTKIFYVKHRDLDYQFTSIRAAVDYIAEHF